MYKFKMEINKPNVNEIKVKFTKEWWKKERNDIFIVTEGIKCEACPDSLK